MRGLFFTIVVLAVSAPAWSTTVYKWVDEAGVVHFSDTPNPKAQKIEVGSAQTYAAPGAAVGSGSQAPQPRQQAPAASSCAVDSPTADQVFQDTFSVSGHASITPALRPGETATVVLDGAPQGSVDADGGFQLSVERGSHTVAVTVQDEDGHVRCQSGAVTFHVRQQSIIAPTAPAAPGVLNPNRPAH